MKFHVICEGSTDQIILEKIIKIVLKDSPEFIEPSNTQTKNRGVHSILKKDKLFPFLHYSFLNRANFIIICVDNDDDPIVNGCPNRYTHIKSYYNEFTSKYSRSYNHRPSNCVIIPVKTIDYWIYAGKMENVGPGTLRGIEDLPKLGIKEKVYGKENVMPNGTILSAAFQEILKYAITRITIENNLKHLNSFLKFYNLLVRLN